MLNNFKCRWEQCKQLRCPFIEKQLYKIVLGNSNSIWEILDTIFFILGQNIREISTSSQSCSDRGVEVCDSNQRGLSLSLSYRACSQPMSLTMHIIMRIYQGFSIFTNSSYKTSVIPFSKDEMLTFLLSALQQCFYLLLLQEEDVYRVKLVWLVTNPGNHILCR